MGLDGADPVEIEGWEIQVPGSQPAMSDVMDPAQPTIGDQHGSLGRRLRHLQVTVIALVLVLAGSGVLAGTLLWSRSGSPAQTSAEVGFARDMYAHHAQAVSMGMLLRNLVPEPFNTLTEEIVTNQAEQQGIMLAWLTSHDALVADETWRSMQWMQGSSTGMNGMPQHGAPAPSAAPTAGPTAAISPGGWAVMPGMATDAQLTELAGLRGTPQEVLFLQLMLPHHRAGSAMAKTYLELGDDPQLRKLANGIITGQEREITIMNDWLTDRGATADS